MFNRVILWFEGYLPPPLLPPCGYRGIRRCRLRLADRPAHPLVNGIRVICHAAKSVLVCGVPLLIRGGHREKRRHLPVDVMDSLPFRYDVLCTFPVSGYYVVNLEPVSTYRS